MGEFRQLIKSKFAKDSLWLLGSQFILSVCALLINIFIAQHFLSEGFGIYNLSFKIYLIASIFASFATNIIALRYISQFNLSREKEEKCLSTAFSISVISSLIFTIAGILSASFFAIIFKEEKIELCIITLFIGIPFFVANKFYFNIFNGLRKMKLFSFLQSLRWVLIGTIIFIFSFIENYSVQYVCMAFPLTEFIVFLISSAIIKPYFSGWFAWNRKWAKEHFKFGWQSVISYSTVEIYAHTDVFVLGFFTNISTVGLYSFAADIAKNLFAFTDILQTNFNPIITDLWWKKKVNELNIKVKKIRNYTYVLYLFVCSIAIGFYFVLTNCILQDKSYVQSFIPFIILCVGVLLFSGVRTSMSLLELCGFAKIKLFSNLIVLFVGALLNLLLAYNYGVVGVAFSTFIMFVFYALLLDYFSRIKLGINLILGNKLETTLSVDGK
jgi:O-antigen/teichoic acid export membrane protein